MPESLQTVFLLADRPIVNFDPEELKEHPLNREIFGDLLQEEYNALKEDIKERGIQDPLHVVKREGSYIIVSGHQRAKIAKELGIKVPCIIRDDLKDELQIREYLIKDNLLRRHLTTAQKAEIVLALAEIEAERARVRQEATKLVGRGVQKKDIMVAPSEGATNSLSDDEKGRAVELATKKAKNEGLSISKNTVYKAKKILEAAEKDQEIKKEWEKAKAGRTTVERVYNTVKKLERKKEIEKKLEIIKASSNAPLGKVVRCDIKDALQHVQAESVDLVLTDPPYGSDYLHLWDELGKFAEKVLKPGGKLFTYTGKAYLPQVLTHLSNYLEYVWTYAVYLRIQRRYYPLHIFDGWRTIVVFAKPPYKAGKWSCDLLTMGKKSKEWHDWGQAIEEAEEIIEKQTEPGDLVVDPFVGGGTVVIAAYKLGRQYIGLDIDEKAVRTTILRLKEVSNGQD